ncbi:transglutaminase TgpA family protein [Arthrobacter pityocampae]|uniref:transglutaminase TgpA family protein n=1 Tax=Arthrobacter pityocampae TaxID=547334 RepID=UPI003736B8B8
MTGAVLLAVLAASTSLNGVVEPWTWLLPVLGTLVPVLLAMALTRTLRLNGVLTALVGLLALIGALTAQFLRRQSILNIIPGPGTPLELQRLLAQAEETVVSQVAPVLPGAGILLIMCAALGLIAIIVDIFSTTMRMPAASGLGLFTILITPAVVKSNGVGMAAFLATALAFLLLLSTAQRRENRLASCGARVSSGFAARSAIIGSAALAVTVILPMIVPGFNSGAFPQGARLNVWGNSTGLNPAVTLGNDLRNPTGFGRIAYSTNSDAPLYLRAVTLEDFSGRRWEPDQRLEDRQDGVAEIGAEDGTPETAPAGTTVFTRITTQSYSSPWLLSPYAPVEITNLSGNWAWDPANLSILATDGGSTARQQYLVQSRAAELTREGLGAIGPSDDDTVSEVFTDLPEDTPDIVRATTEEVTSEFVNPYDKAMAIQNYLRGTDFTYSVDAPVDGGYDGSGMDVMARFLESKSGYCVHYAGTMAVMARAAGIPSRMAIGYTPGSPTGNITEGPNGTELREFVVDSRNAHSWPELYFEGVGWVQFEPTPSRGVVPTYAQQAFAPVGPRADDTDALNPGELPGANGQTDTATQPSDADDSTQSVGPQNNAGPGVVLLIVAGIAVLTLCPLLLRTARTKARRRSVVVGIDGASHGAATTAWAETTEIAGDYGYPMVPTDTPRTFAQRLARDAPLRGEPATSLSRLRTAYEYEEYSNHGPESKTGRSAGAQPPATIARPMTVPRWEDVHAVTRALRRGSPWSTRLKARLFPQSLLNRFRHASPADKSMA